MIIRAVVHKAAEGGLWAEVPALPGCVSQVESLDELRANLREAVEVWFEAGEAEGREGSEDQILELIDTREKAEAEVADLRREREAAQAEKDRLDAIIKEEWRAIDADIARAEVRKKGIVALIVPDLLDLYEELRPHKEGVAVGRLSEGICGGCHLRLSAAEQVQVLRESPPRCLHCRRLLVPQ